MSFVARSSQIFDQINTYRGHVAAAYLILVYVQLHRWGEVNTITLSALFSFTSLLLGTYGINKYFDYEEDLISQTSEARKSTTLAVLSSALLVLPIGILALVGAPIVPYVLFVPVALLYCVPIFGRKLKSIFILKNIYAAGAWWLSAALILSFYTDNQSSFGMVILGTAAIFFIVLVFELLWDIRDLSGDRKVSTHTIPLLLGLPATKCLMLTALFLAWVVEYFTLDPIFLTNLGFLAVAGLLAKESYRANYFHVVVYIQIMLLLSRLW